MGVPVRNYVCKARVSPGLESTDPESITALPPAFSRRRPSLTYLLRTSHPYITTRLTLCAHAHLAAQLPCSHTLTHLTTHLTRTGGTAAPEAMVSRSCHSSEAARCAWKSAAQFFTQVSRS